LDGIATAVALSLFPSLDYRSLEAGPYTFEQGTAPLLSEGIPMGGTQGLEIMTRRIRGTPDQLVDMSDRGSIGEMRLRLAQETDGSVRLDQFELESALLSIRVRPEMGDQLDFGMFAGQHNQSLFVRDGGRGQFMVYSPQTMTLLGLSRSDMGSEKLKYYAEIGTGLGLDGILRVAGPFTLQARAEIEGTARRRRERTDVDYVVRESEGNTLHHSTRQEVVAEAELGVGYMRDRKAYSVVAWGQHVTQWEPWDEGGQDGIDRAYFAVGAKLSGRFYKNEAPQRGPDIREMELEELLEAIRAQEDEATEGPAVGPEPEPEPELILPMEVHWSEVSFSEQVMPIWPAGTPDEFECSVQLYVDTTGVPFLVEAEDCPTPLIDSSVTAAELWRIAPILKEGETVSARFVYTLTTDEVEVEQAIDAEAEPQPAQSE
jgi:hypothetical protein